MWLALERIGDNQFKAFQLIGIMLVYSMVFGSTPTLIAEVSSFLIGLFIAPLLAPCSWMGFISRIRKRA